MPSGFEVIHGGIFTLIQDRGRFGFNSLGVSTSGVMDEYAYLYANKLLENDLETNVLEVLFTGLTLKATSSFVISITGADLSFSINDKSFTSWQTFNIKKDDILTFKKSILGQRAYLAVKNGFDIKKEFGSCATTIKESLGGLTGKVLKKGDFLFCETSFQSFNKKLKSIHHPNYNENLTLRVVLGYQEEFFSREEKEKFFSKEFVVTNETNRMGIKLKGESVHSSIDGIISEGISFGAIQEPKDGQPIVLLKERQTIGGYPKIGSVLSIDCFKLSQLKANSKIRFEEISLEKAKEKLKKFYSLLK